MKKVLSFLLLSLILAFAGRGVKAQSGLVCDPLNLSLQVNVSDTFYINATSSCFDALGLSDDDKISIKYTIFKDGVIIPDDSLTMYFNSFKFETRYDLGTAERWWGRDYTDDYCNSGNGQGFFPGAYTPIHGNGNECELSGYFAVTLPGHNNPYEFDFFFVKFFKDALNTGHRLILNPKIEANYEIVLELYKNIDGTKWDLLYVGNDERYYIGGHHSTPVQKLTSDTLFNTVYGSKDTVTICVGDIFYYGTNPVQAFSEATPAGSLDTAYFYNTSSCNKAVDSVITFFLVVENPLVPTLDEANSILQLCDGGDAAILATPEMAGAEGKVIWCDGSKTPVDTTDTGEAFHPHFNSGFTGDSTFYALSYNSLSTCVSPDTLKVTVEVYASPVPQVASANICADKKLEVWLNDRYTGQQWFFNGTEIQGATDTAYNVLNAQPANSGWYRADVKDEHVHSVYTTLSIFCTAQDSVEVAVYTRPTVAITGFDAANFNIQDTLIQDFICPKDTVHTIYATITPGSGTIDGTSIGWASGVTGNTTRSITATSACDRQYTDTLIYAIDDNGCTLKNKASLTFRINDTIKPEITDAPDSVAAEPKGSDCQYKVPDLLAAVTASDNCDSIVKTQNPAPGTYISDTTPVTITVTDMCNNSDEATVILTIPSHVDIDTSSVKRVLCFGDNNGSVNVSVDKGNAPYNIKLTNGTIDYTGSLTEAGNTTFSGLTAGTWKVSVVDNNGCTDTVDNIEITSPDVLTLTATGTNLLCNNDHTGKLHFKIAGGTRPYHTTIIKTIMDTIMDTVYNVAVNEHRDSIIQLPVGTYRIAVKDANGCEVDTTIGLTEPEPLRIVSFETVNAGCYGTATGSAAAVVTGGSLPYTFSWTDADNTVVSTDSLTGKILTAGTYTLQVIDAHGCSDNKDTTIDQPGREPVVVGTIKDTTVTGCTTDEITRSYSTVDSLIKAFREDINISQHLMDTSVMILTHQDEIIQDACPIKVKRSYTVADTCGNDTTFSYNITIENTVSPSFKKPKDTTLYVDIHCAVDITRANLGNPVVSYEHGCGSLDGSNATYRDSIVEGCVGEREIHRIWRLEDGCHHQATTEDSIQVITIEDTFPPTLTLTTHTLVIPCDSVEDHVEAKRHIVAAPENATTSDQCSNVSLTIDTIVIPGACEYTYTEKYIFTATDDCGNSIRDSAFFIVKDTILPKVIPPAPVTCSCEENIDSVMEAWEAKVEYSDNCVSKEDLIVEIDSVYIPGACRGEYEWKITWTVNDGCNEKQDSSVFTVFDKGKPEIHNVPTEYEYVECDGDGNKQELQQWISGVYATDKCSVGAELKLYYHDITLDDTVLFDPTVLDADGIHYKGWQKVGSGECEGFYDFEWIAIDSCGNVQSAEERFYIRDQEGPFFAEPRDTTVYCGGISTADYRDACKEWADRITTAYDSCSKTNFTVTNNADVTPFYQGCGTTGSYVVTWTSSDACGNTRYYSKKYIIIDTVAPEIWGSDGKDAVVNDTIFPNDTFKIKFDEGCYPTLPAVVYGKSVDELISEGAIAGVEECCKHSDIHVWFEYEFKRNEGCSKIYLKTYHIEDACTNDTTFYQYYVLVDEESPTALFTQVKDDSIHFNPDCTVPSCTVSAFHTYGDLLGWDPEAKFQDCNLSDAAPLTLQGTDTLKEGCKWTITHKYTLSDNCGNTSAFNVKAIVTDTLPPVVTGTIADTTWKTDVCHYKGNIMTEIPEFATPQAAVDYAGDLTITDCNIDMDNSSLIHLERADTTGTCPTVIQRTYTVKDNCGNISIEFTQRISVQDTMPATITGTLKDTTIYYGSYEECAIPPMDTLKKVSDVNAYKAATGSDLTYEDCNISDDDTVVLVKIDTTGNPCEQNFTRHYRMGDDCGNLSAGFTQTIILKDTTRPVVSGTLNTITLYLDTPACEIKLPLAYTTVQELRENGLTVNDCHLSATEKRVDSIDTQEIPGTVCPKKYVRTYTVKDDCGNISTEFTQFIEYEDTLKPVVTKDTINAFDTVLIDASGCGFELRPPFTKVSEVKAYDSGWDVTDCNIDDESVVKLIEEDTLTRHCPLQVIRHYIVIDKCNNESEPFYQVNNVYDTTSPQIAGVMNDITVYMSGYDNGCALNAPSVYTSVTDLNGAGTGLTITDCNLNDILTCEADTAHIAVIGTAADNDYAYVITRTYTTKDSCGNNTTFKHIIHVKDNLSPVISDDLKDSIIYLSAVCDTPEVDILNNLSDIEAYPGKNGAITVTDCQPVDKVMLDSTRYTKFACPDTIIRYYHIIDSTGNKTSFEQKILVEDSIHPKVTGTLRDTFCYSDNSCGFVLPEHCTDTSQLTALGITITDCHHVSIASWADDSSSVNSNSSDSYVTRTYTIKDECGNDTAVTQKIEIKDTIKPWFTRTISTEVADTAGSDCKFDIPNVVDSFTGQDNCSGVEITQVPVSGAHTALSYEGPTTVTVMVYITDSSQNKDSTAVTITLPEKPQITELGVDSAKCNPANSGKIIVTATSAYGEGDYRYRVRTGGWQTSNTIVDLAKGDYTVEVEDANGCIARKDTTVFEYSHPELLTLEVDSVSCWGESNGKIKVTAGQGHAPYTYYCINETAIPHDTLGGTANYVFSNLDTANYKIRVVDDYGCDVTRDTAVGGPDMLVVKLTFDNSSICFGNSVQLQNTVSGGTGGYHYIITHKKSNENDTIDMFDATALETNYPYYPELDSIDSTLSDSHGMVITQKWGGRDSIFTEVKDSRGCEAKDTGLLTVDTAYLIIDCPKPICRDSTYKWIGHKGDTAITLPSTVTKDTTLIIFDSLKTADHLCDSIWRLKLVYRSDPHIMINRIGGSDLWDNVEQNGQFNDENVHHAVEYVSGEEGYEIMVLNPCGVCNDTFVSLEFDWFKKDEESGVFEPITDNVTDYFTLTYRTYLDMAALQPQRLQTPHVSVPNDYPTLSMGSYHGAHWDCFRLPFLAPKYDTIRLFHDPNNPYFTPSNASGTFNRDGRVTTLSFLQYRTEGEYLLKISLVRRNNPALSYFSGYATVCDDWKIGGDNSQLTTTVLDIDALTFRIEGSITPVTPEPIVNPMEGVTSGNSTDVIPIVSVYPNPARDYVQIELSGFEGETDVMLSNSDGKVIHMTNIDIADSEDTPIVKVNTADCAQGIYMVTARSKEVVVTKRVVIVR